MTSKINFTKDLLWVGLASISTKIRGLIIVPILTKILGVESYGAWSQMITFVGLMALIAELNIHMALLRFASGEVDKKIIASVFWTSMLIVLIINIVTSSIILTFQSSVAFLCFGGEEYLSYIGISAILIILLSLNSVATAFFRVIHKSKLFAFVYTIQAGLDVVGICFPILFLQTGLVGAIWGYIFAQGLCLLLIIIYVLALYGYKSGTLNAVKTYLIYVLPMFPSLFAGWLFSYSDRYFIVHYQGLHAVGIYTVAYMLGQLIMVCIIPINKVLLPTTVKYWEQGSMHEVQSYLSLSNRYFSLAAIPIVFILCALSPSLYMLLTTKEFLKDGPIMVPMISVGVFFYGLSQINLQVFYLTKKTVYIGMIWLIAAAINVISNFIIVPVYGAIGAAITSLISYFYIFLHSYLASRKLFYYPSNLFHIGRVFIAAMPILIAVMLPPLSIIWLILVIALCGLCYVTLLIATKAISKEEILYIRKLTLGIK